jgi:esterase/lipase superfamily enzyme
VRYCSLPAVSYLRRQRLLREGNFGQGDIEITRSSMISVRAPSVVRRFREYAVTCLALICLALLSACANGKSPGMTNLATGSGPKTTAVSPAQSKAGKLDVLYVTDRAPIVSSSGALSYGSGRDRAISFGSVSLAFPATPADRPADARDAPLKVVATTRTGAFPPAPYAIQATAKGPERLPATVEAHEKAAAALKGEISRRLSLSKRKEVIVFIHGYSNTFNDAVESTGKICRTLSMDFVCIALTWPAGGSGGVFQGYNIDRESSEFAVADIKKAIRIISGTPGIERIHLLAHSRGTDVLLTAIQQLGIEAYVARSSPAQRYKLSNVVLFAPDIDLDVAVTKLFGVVSDPDIPFGSRPKPFGAFPPLGSLHLTVYSSPNDKAIALSSFLFGSVVRLGRLTSVNMTTNMSGSNALWENSQTAGIADFIEYKGQAGFFGHGYFNSDPAVREDLVALLRDRLKAGDPGRPLVEVKRPFWRIADASKATN